MDFHKPEQALEDDHDTSDNQDAGNEIPRIDSKMLKVFFLHGNVSPDDLPVLEPQDGIGYLCRLVLVMGYIKQR